MKNPLIFVVQVAAVAILIIQAPNFLLPKSPAISTPSVPVEQTCPAPTGVPIELKDASTVSIGEGDCPPAGVYLGEGVVLIQGPAPASLVVKGVPGQAACSKDYTLILLDEPILATAEVGRISQETTPAIWNYIASCKPKPALTFAIDFDPNLSQDQIDAVNYALNIWQSKITGPQKEIKLKVYSVRGDGWIAQAAPLEGEGVNVTFGDVRINTPVFNSSELGYTPEDKGWIIAHEICHVLGAVTQFLPGDSSIELDGINVPTGTPGHFAMGVNDLMTPAYVKNHRIDLALAVLEKAGYSVIRNPVTQESAFTTGGNSQQTNPPIESQGGMGRSNQQQQPGRPSGMQQTNRPFTRGQRRF